MIVIDTSVMVDSVFEKNNERNKKANEFLNSLEGLVVFTPKIIFIEFMAISKRLGVDISKEEIRNVLDNFVSLSEDDLFEEAFRIAEEIHPRSIDAYFIAVAKLTNSLLISNDKTMVENGKKIGLESYYLIEEFNKVISRIKEFS